jgi:hypothetical protein
MKIQTKSTFGNFAIEAEVEATDSQRDALATLGLLQLLQRSPASAAEKALAGYDKRPEGFKRNSIEFTEANAATLTEAMEKPLAVGDGVADLQATVVVSEYVPTVGEVKMTAEREAYARHAGDLEAFAKVVGYAGTDLGDGTKDGAPADFVRAIRKYSQDVVAGL